MTQVIDFIGGEYRNRTGVHGFAIRTFSTDFKQFFVHQTSGTYQKHIRNVRQRKMHGDEITEVWCADQSTVRLSGTITRDQAEVGILII